MRTRIAPGGRSAPGTSQPKGRADHYFAASDSWGFVMLVQWRAEYAELMLLVKGIRDSEGRIDYLVVRQ